MDRSLSRIDAKMNILQTAQKVYDEATTYNTEQEQVLTKQIEDLSATLKASEAQVRGENMLNQRIIGLTSQLTELLQDSQYADRAKFLHESVVQHRTLALKRRAVLLQ